MAPKVYKDGTWIRNADGSPFNLNLLAKLDSLDLEGGRGHHGVIPPDTASLDDLEDGVWSVASAAVSTTLGIPGGALGSLYLATIVNGRTAMLVTDIAGVLANSSSGGEWGAWSMIGDGEMTEALERKADKDHDHLSADISDKTVSVGPTSGANKVLALDYQGKMRIDTASVTLERDVASKGYVDNMDWRRGTVGLSETLDTLAQGSWGVANGTVASNLGLPVNYGALTIQYVNNSKTALFVATTGEVYTAVKNSGTWGTFEKIGDSGLPGGTADSAPVGLKTVPIAVTSGAGSATAPATATFRSLTHFGAPITRWRLHITNTHPLSGGDYGGMTLGPISVAPHTGDGQMGTARTILDEPVVITGTEEWVSDWITGIDFQAEHLIEYAYDAPSAPGTLGAGWQIVGGTPTQVNRLGLWVWLEAETYEQTPVVAMIGDSTGGGHGSIAPIHDAALSIAGRKQGFLPVLYTNSGDTLAGNISVEDRNFAKWSGFATPDSVIVQAGSNDVHSGATVDELKSRFEGAAEVARQLAPVVFAATIKPRYPSHAEYDVNRAAYNDWLYTQPAGIRAVIDFSDAIAPGGEVPAEYNDDAAHLNSSGHHKMAEAFTFPICRPRAEHTWAN